VATLVVTVLYITFILSFTELTTAIPQAGGPFAYAHRALGPLGGLVAGYATLVEFLLAPPAIAFALGSYGHFLHPAVPVLGTAVGCYVVFTIINLLGIRESARFSLVVTVLAVAELLVFMGVMAPHFRVANFLAHPVPLRLTGVLAALPFAIWFYLAIEGVAMVAEEVKEGKNVIAKGYISAVLTLAFLALTVMISVGGITNWENLDHLDYPMPEAIALVLGRQNPLTKFFASVGLFGLIASFHGIIISYSRQIFALARSGYLPHGLALVSKTRQVPVWALMAGAVFGIIALLSFDTSKLVILSTIGAVVVYIVSMLALFRLRQTQPALPRLFKAPLYPYFPALALVLAIVTLVAMIYFYSWLSFLFFTGLVILSGVFYVSGRYQKVKQEWQREMVTSPAE